MYRESLSSLKRGGERKWDRKRENNRDKGPEERGKNKAQNSRHCIFRWVCVNRGERHWMDFSVPICFLLFYPSWDFIVSRRKPWISISCSVCFILQPMSLSHSRHSKCPAVRPTFLSLCFSMSRGCHPSSFFPCQEVSSLIPCQRGIERVRETQGR